MQTTTRKPNLLIHACPRCHGDLYRDMLEQDVEYVCLQCGRRAVTRQPLAAVAQDEDDDWQDVA